MYINITKQHLDATFSQSCADFVTYLEKENEGKELDRQEHFFNQYHDHIPKEEVIKEIDGNRAKLKQSEPKFYSLTINPSQRELRHIQNNPDKLKAYVREVMKDYAASFYRNNPVTVDNLKYYAKLEYERTFKGYDKQVKENQVYRAKIAKLEYDLRRVIKGEIKGNANTLKKKIAKLEAEIPHRINGKPVVQGMKKSGLQTHIHIIVSRKDATNRYSLSPGSKYMESETSLNGKLVKRGFKRDQFFENAEKRFDKMFLFKRHFVESYQARKTLLNDPKFYYAHLLGLPTNERSAAFKLIGTAGENIPRLHIPTNKVEVVLQMIKKLKRAVEVAKDAGSIGI